MNVLVAGIGNIFHGDDGFGVEVVRRLREHPFGDGVEIADFGIRGVHLAFELAGGGYDGVVLIDAVHCGGEPGTLYVIEPALDARSVDVDAADAHNLTPDAVLAWLARVGARPERLVIVGCEPETTGEGMGLSSRVDKAVDRAIAITTELVAQLTSTAKGHSAASCA